MSYIRTKEHKEMMSCRVKESLKNNPRPPLSLDARHKISIANKNNKAFLGHRHSWKTRHRMSIIKQGENCHFWRGGKSFESYPLGWTRTFKEQIRYRDGYKCQICGVPEVECKRKLDVHHIDYDKKNLLETNLTSLCKSCHSKTNFNHQYWEEYFYGKYKLQIC